MMTNPQSMTRPVILRARRDTIVLVVTAAMATFAMAHVVQSRRIAMQQDEPRQGWTGALTGVATQAATVDASEPLTSASLVVPEAELALPQAPVRALVKLRGCDGGSCTSRPASRAAAVPTPPRKLAGGKPGALQVAVIEDRAPTRSKRSLMSRLNPLTHLPDTSAIKRPFTFASDAVSGWFKHF